MKYVIFFTDTAVQDMQDLQDFLTVDVGADVARKVLHEIMQAVRSLGVFAYRYPRHLELWTSRHVMPISSWCVWYSIRNDEILIDRVLHRRRDHYSLLSDSRQ